jgi:hypothetical protein
MKRRRDKEAKSGYETEIKKKDQGQWKVKSNFFTEEG